MNISLFSNKDKPGYRVVATTTITEVLQQAGAGKLLDTVIEDLTKKLSKYLYPIIRKELLKRKPRIVREILQKFIDAEVEHLLKK